MAAEHTQNQPGVLEKAGRAADEILRLVTDPKVTDERTRTEHQEKLAKFAGMLIATLERPEVANLVLPAGPEEWDDDYSGTDHNLRLTRIHNIQGGIVGKKLSIALLDPAGTVIQEAWGNTPRVCFVSQQWERNDDVIPSRFCEWTAITVGGYVLREEVDYNRIHGDNTRVLRATPMAIASQPKLFTPFVKGAGWQFERASKIESGWSEYLSEAAAISSSATENLAKLEPPAIPSAVGIKIPE